MDQTIIKEHPFHRYYLKEFYDLYSRNGVSGEQAYFSWSDKGIKIPTNDPFRLAQLMVMHRRKSIAFDKP